MGVWGTTKGLERFEKEWWEENKDQFYDKVDELTSEAREQGNWKEDDITKYVYDRIKHLPTNEKALEDWENLMQKFRGDEVDTGLKELITDRVEVNYDDKNMVVRRKSHKEELLRAAAEGKSFQEFKAGTRDYTEKEDFVKSDGTVVKVTPTEFDTSKEVFEETVARVNVSNYYNQPNYKFRERVERLEKPIGTFNAVGATPEDTTDRLESKRKLNYIKARGGSVRLSGRSEEEIQGTIDDFYENIRVREDAESESKE